MSGHALELGYVRLEVVDPDAVGGLFTDIIGLAPGPDTAAGEATWTDDAAVARVIVAEGPADDLAAVGIEAVDGAAHEAVIEHLVGAGFAPVEGDASTCTARRVERLVTVDAPWGTPVEVVVGLARDSQPQPTPLVPGGFLTAEMGFGHAVIGTTALDESLRFVTDGLGMVRSDWIRTEVAPGIPLEVHFFHCNARHHTLALARVPFDGLPSLHHLMVETNERDDVGRAYDRAVAAGLALPNGLGRHDNDEMFSFYVSSPSRFQVEVGHGARRIVEPWTDDRRYDRISAWGHHPVAPTGCGSAVTRWGRRRSPDLRGRPSSRRTLRPDRSTPCLTRQGRGWAGCVVRRAQSAGRPRSWVTMRAGRSGSRSRPWTIRRWARMAGPASATSSTSVDAGSSPLPTAALMRCWRWTRRSWTKARSYSARSSGLRAFSETKAVMMGPSSPDMARRMPSNMVVRSARRSPVSGSGTVLHAWRRSDSTTTCSLLDQRR